jgi:CheY-like chemotaxis protein
MNRILIVDDLAENRYLLEKLLEGNGYEIMAANNGTEALAAALKTPPDIVISDILMPGMDGFALCREWMKNAGLKRIPFIFYTATYTDQQDEEFALNLGAARFVIKPQETGVFLSIIRQTLTEYEKGRIVVKEKPEPEEKVFLKEYNEALIRKLEDKLAQLESTEKELKRLNAELVKDVEKRRQTEEELVRKIRELENWHEISIERESRMHELKKQVNELSRKLGNPVPYPNQERGE